METSFYFQSQAVESDTFRVIALEGEEEISRLFQFEVDLISEDREVDLDAMLSRSAFLGMEREEGLLKIHGLLAHFEQREMGPNYVHYHAVLVPRLWLLTLTRQNQIYQDMTVKEIIEDELKGSGFTTDDYDFRLSREYPKNEYVVQYQETDLNFISRLMEHQGMFFFFDHTDGKDRLIIADSNAAFGPIPGNNEVVFRPPSGMETSAQESVQALICRQKRIPKKMILKDYNYRKSHVDLKVEEEIDGQGLGTVSEYGNHYKEQKEGGILARIRAEEIRCRQKRFLGESDCIAFQSGYKYTLKDHYRSDFDNTYLIVGVKHSGSQSSAYVSGVGEESDDETSYRNEFSTILTAVPFRPERITPKPKLYGIMNAKVDAAGTGEYAEVDDQGRYKVVIPFDISGKGGAKASRYVRMAQPYSGPGYGMHFPLHKNSEVILTCVDGDPDRPLICGTVPNPENASPITAASHTKSRLATAAKNEIMMEDQAGEEKIIISTPNVNSKIYMGATASTDGIRMTTDGHGVLHAKKGIYLNAWPTDYWSTGDASQYINAGVAAANVIGVAAAAAGAGSLAAIPAIMGIASAVANIAVPGIVLASPSGISAITPSTFTAVGIAGIGLFTPAVADIVGVTSASLMSGGGVNIFTVAGGIRCVAAAGDIDIHAKTGNIKGTALQNISLTAKTNNIALQAKKEIDVTAETDDITLHALAKDIGLIAKKNILGKAEEENIEFTAKKNIKGKAEEENIEFTAKKNIKGTAEEENIEFTAKKSIKGTAQDESIELTGKKKIVITATDEKVELKCGDSSIILEKSGKIQIKGKDIDMDGGSGPIKIHGGKIDLN